MSRRKGLPAAGLTTFLGIAGDHTGFWAMTERRHWLYGPAVVLQGNKYGLVATRLVSVGWRLAGVAISEPVHDRGRLDECLLLVGAERAADGGIEPGLARGRDSF